MLVYILLLLYFVYKIYSFVDKNSPEDNIDGLVTFGDVKKVLKPNYCQSEFHEPSIHSEVGFGMSCYYKGDTND